MVEQDQGNARGVLLLDRTDVQPSVVAAAKRALARADSNVQLLPAPGTFQVGRPVFEAVRESLAAASAVVVLFDQGVTYRVLLDNARELSGVLVFGTPAAMVLPDNFLGDIPTEVGDFVAIYASSPHEIEDKLTAWLRDLFDEEDNRASSAAFDGLAVTELRVVEAFLVRFVAFVESGEVKSKEVLLELDLLAQTLNLQIRMPKPHRSIIKPTLNIVGGLLLNIGASVLYAELPVLH